MKAYLVDRYGADDANWPKENLLRVSYPTDRPNFVIVYTPNCDLAFSYETLVAVQGFMTKELRHPAEGAYRPAKGAYRFRQWLVAENTWGPTTGKHLNWLDNGHKEDRVSQAEVEIKAVSLITGEAQAELTDLHTAHDAAIEAFKS